LLVGVSSGGQRDPVGIGFCDLKKRGERNRVREWCESKREEEVQITNQGEAEAYSKTAMYSFSSGGAAASFSAAWRRFLARVSGG
jgi:hypothetical protein